MKIGIEFMKNKLSKEERHSKLKSLIDDDPFLTDEDLSNKFNVSIQTIRLDRMTLNIPEVRKRIKARAEQPIEISSLKEDEIIGEIIDITLNKSAISMLTIKANQVFDRNHIARGHILFAQANSLSVALIQHDTVLTRSASVNFVKPVYLNDQVITKAKASRIDNKFYNVEVQSEVKGQLVFKGTFKMYYKS